MMKMKYANTLAQLHFEVEVGSFNSAFADWSAWAA